MLSFKTNFAIKNIKQWKEVCDEQSVLLGSVAPKIIYLMEQCHKNYLFTQNVALKQFFLNIDFIKCGVFREIVELNNENGVVEVIHGKEGRIWKLYN